MRNKSCHAVVATPGANDRSPGPVGTSSRRRARSLYSVLGMILTLAFASRAAAQEVTINFDAGVDESISYTESGLTVTREATEEGTRCIRFQGTGDKQLFLKKPELGCANLYTFALGGTPFTLKSVVLFNQENLNSANFVFISSSGAVEPLIVETELPRTHQFPAAGWAGITSFEWTLGGSGFPPFDLLVIDNLNILPPCGDGVVTSGETCDDGSTNDGDGCSAVCLVEFGFECTGEPSVCTEICPGAMAGTPCPDGNVCNGDERCDGAGACNAGTPLNCDDGNRCTIDFCDAVSGGCQHTQITTGTLCEAPICVSVERDSTAGTLTVTYTKDSAICGHLANKINQSVHVSNFYCSGGGTGAVAVTRPLTDFSTAAGADGDLINPLFLRNGNDARRITACGPILELGQEPIVDDDDFDGIFNPVDPEPNRFSRPFSDGMTTGIILTRGAQYVTVRDSTLAAPEDGVLVTFSGGGYEASATACDGIESDIVMASSLDVTEMHMTCGNSVTTGVLSGGPAQFTFFADNGTVATTSLSEGNTLTFDETTTEITAEAANADIVIILVDGMESALAPGETIILLTRVSIDIKPGSDPNSINLGSSGVIPVAILSTADFDAATVNPDNLMLAGARIRVAGRSGHTLCHSEDTNGDGLLDLVCQFENDLDAQVGDSILVLEGETFDGTLIRGEDSISIVPNS